LENDMREIWAIERKLSSPGRWGVLRTFWNNGEDEAVARAEVVELERFAREFQKHYGGGISKYRVVRYVPEPPLSERGL
jgi:hypothetical protein